MPKYIKLKDHLKVSEIERRYRATADGVERSHWQIIWLLAQGKRTREVAEITGYSVVWIRALVKRYNANGPAGLDDTRHDNPGRRALLNANQLAQLRTEVAAAEQVGQPWNGVQVAAWMSQCLGQPVYAVRGWEVLSRWGFTRKLPRIRHAKVDLTEQAAFKKT